MVWDMFDPKPDPEWEKTTSAIPGLASLTSLKSWQKGSTVEGPPVKEEAQPRDDGEAIECDYERNCTRLYKAIEDAINESEWKPIIKFLDTGYWPGTVFADDISPKTQAMTWVTRFDPNNNTVVKWSQLPLHLAIVCGAPFSVVGRLIELYPQGVRCTDDQRMLPIHLALRHNANDDTVAYLLLQFPESVNAKGKDGRTPIQCALRAESKVRGKILEIFVTKTKTKVKTQLSEGASDKDKKIQMLENQLEAKTLELNSAMAKLDALSTAKVEVEDKMVKRIMSVEQKKAQVEKESSHAIENLQDQKLVDEIKLQMKIDGLQAEKKKIEEAERKAREEEASLRQDLETVSRKIEAAKSPEELEQIKDDVKSIKLGRMEQEKQSTKNQLEEVVEELDEITKKEGKIDAEIKSMKKQAEQINSVISTDDDIASLKSNVVELKAKLKEREAAAKTVEELTALRAKMEDELKKDSTPKAMAASMKDAVASMKDLDDKSPEELVKLKESLEGVQKEMTKSELVTKTKKDIEVLKQALEAKPDGTVKAQLEKIETKLGADDITTDDLLTLKKELGVIKDTVNVEEKITHLRAAILELKKELQSDAESTKDIKKAIKSADEKALDGKSVDELDALKNELEALKLKSALDKELAKAKKEIESMKKSLEESEKVWEGKNKQGIADIKKAVVAFSSKQFADVDSLNGELKTIREDVENASRATKVKKDLGMLKDTLDEALKNADSDSSVELVAMKKAVHSISVDGLAIKNKKQWDAIDEELTALKDDLKSKDVGQGLLKKEIADLKSLDDTKSKKSSSTKKKWLKGLLTPFRRSKQKDLNSELSQSQTRDPEPEVVTILPPSLPAGAAEAEQQPEEREDVAHEHTDAETDEDQPVADEASESKKSVKVVEKEPSKEEASNESKTGGGEEASVSMQSRKSVKSAKSTKSKKSVATEKSAKSKKSAKSAKSKVSAKSYPSTGEIELEATDEQ